jgi:hypothetical protein
VAAVDQAPSNPDHFSPAHRARQGVRRWTTGTPRSSALAFAAVGKRVFVVYEAFGSGAEPQVLGVASSAARAEELAERYAGEDRCAWRGPDWLEWDSARRVRPAVDGRGNAVEVWLVEVGLDELIRLVLEPEPLVEEHD